MDVLLFEEPIPPGWVYPCTLEDVAERLGQLPAEDLEGIWSVGLAAATRKDCWANGRYFPHGRQSVRGRPSICLYSHADTYTFKLGSHTKASEIERGLAVELEFGMTVERSGSRYVCRWEADDLRQFIVGHVLAHEVGHHVDYKSRERQGLQVRLRTWESEKFAEAYARRHARMRDAGPNA